MLIASWICAVVAAGILGQTLFFKFSGAPESIHIFTTLGVEPWGRYASGIAELIAVVLLLVPATRAIGGGLTVGIMAGAILSHIAKLGIAVPNSDGTTDGGTLFILACVALITGAVAAWLHRTDLPVVGRLFATAPAV